MSQSFVFCHPLCRGENHFGEVQVGFEIFEDCHISGQGMFVWNF